MSKKFKLFLSYTLVFLFTIVCSSVFFFVYGKSCFVGDGLAQHLTSLIYYGDYLRSIICSFLTTRRISLPLWDFSLGFGADIIETLHYYCIGDPLALLAVFVKAENATVLYVILIVLRLYLSGLTFMLFCCYHKFDRFSVLCGAEVYVFSGFALFCASRHPFFINPMIYLPLLCLGVDFVFEKKKSALFIFAVFISCVSNFYFFYMLSVITVIYAIVSFFFVFKREERKNIWKFFLIFLGAYILGVMLAAPIFFPQIYGFLNSARSSEIEKISLFYRPIYYIKFFLSFIAPPTFDSYSALGFAAPVLPVFIYFLSKKDNTSRKLKIFFAIGTIFFLFPVFANFFNGFSYHTNRWCFAFAFLVSVMFVFVLPDLYNADIKKLKWPILISTILSLLVLLISVVEKKTRAELSLSYLVLLLFCIVVFVLVKKKKSLKLSFFFFIVLAVIVNISIRYGNFGLRYLDNFIDAKIAKSILKENVPYEDLSKDVFFRIETASRKNINSPLLAGLNGTTYYWSENSRFLSDFYKGIDLCSGASLSCHGLNRRTPLLSLTSVSFLEKNDEDCSPFGFRKTEIKSVSGLDVFENENILPFGFIYKKVINESQVESLSPLERQELMLDYVIVSDATNNFESKDIEFPSNISKVPFHIEAEDGISFEGNRLTVNRSNAKFHLVFSDDENTETYLYIKDIFSETNPYKELLFTTRPEGKNPIEKAVILSNYSDIGHTFTFCYGYNTESLGSVEVSFQSVGTYSFEDLALYSVSREGFSEKIQSLSKNSLQDLNLDTNRISGTISVPERAFLFLSIPFSKGWTCFVDGEKTDTFVAQYAFTGVSLEPGSHIVELKYHSPFFCVGCIAFFFSAVFLVCVSLVCVFQKKLRVKS